MAGNAAKKTHASNQQLLSTLRLAIGGSFSLFLFLSLFLKQPISNIVSVFVVNAASGFFYLKLADWSSPQIADGRVVDGGVDLAGSGLTEWMVDLIGVGAIVSTGAVLTGWVWGLYVCKF
ncbi:hypothetical protein HK096_008435 [Nowakowskiella sp. JEL0078]|nr:hypothetical protein HK096_008435 [Nowakowskiella sp. JEL0078]